MKNELKIMAPKVSLLSLMHFLVDFICASNVVKEVYYLEGGSFFYILAYNCFAFLLQPFFGLLVDKYNKKKHLKIFLTISIVMIMTGFLFSLRRGIDISIFFSFGVGNALFHVVGGKEVLTDNNKASYSGLFVSTGAIGVGLSVLYRPRNIVEPSLKLLMSLAIVVLIICYLIYLTRRDRENISMTKPYSSKFFNHGLITTALIVAFAVSIRSIAGKYGSQFYSWKFSEIEYIIIFAIFAFVGKAIGGIILDLAGPKPLIIMSWFTSFMCIFSTNDFLLPCILFTFSINLLMPLTLDMMRRVCPKKEGFAFGFTASFLTISILIARLLEAIPGYEITITKVVFMITLSCIILFVYFLDRLPIKSIMKNV